MDLKIGTIAGAPVIIRTNWFIFVLVFSLITLFNSGVFETLLTIGAILSISIFVLLHEFGHVLVARKYGIKTDSISLNFFGGVAKINDNDLPELINTPKKTLFTWLAGPLVNIGLFLLLMPM